MVSGERRRVTGRSAAKDQLAPTDAQERVPPADATRRQGGRATLLRGRATGEGGREGSASLPHGRRGGDVGGIGPNFFGA